MPSHRSYRKRSRSRSVSPYYSRRSRSRSRSYERGRRSRSRDRKRDHYRRDRKRSRSRSRSRERRRRSRSRDRSRRSRSRDRRSRSRDRRSRRSPERKRKRSHSREPTTSDKQEKVRSKSKSPAKEMAISVDKPLDKEAEQNRLEKEMQKRRERIEQWRAERKQRNAQQAVTVVPPSKVWSLEDDDEDDITEEQGTNGENNEDEVDPLDAYMAEVSETVKKDQPDLSHLNNNENGSSKVNTAKVTMITAVAKKDHDPTKSKGELMESNMDALEYSSEEEEEDLETTMLGLTKKKKDLVKTDHEKVYYRAFRKEFYVEVPELKNMTEEETEQLREELEGIKVRGKNVARPIKTWAQCGVSRKILELLKRNKFEKPTPIQAQAIPIIMSGRDMIGIAKTGSGKTLAFLIPMFRHILDQPELDEDDGPIAIILTPTRELAMQITRECKRFAKALNLNPVAVYGGTGISEQIAELKRGSEIITCTPGRMIDMLAANAGRVTNLRRVTYIVLDEADRMFDMGFEPQVMRIIDNVRPDRQTVLFSATFPRQMEALARRILNKPIEVQVGGKSVVCNNVQQHVVLVDEEQKLFKLLELLGMYQEFGSALVFVDKQENADELMRQLMQHSYPCLSLHGGIDQYDRDSIILDFKSGDVKLLIATSVAARGLDVKELVLVVNYDCPNHYEDYVHRCGRTGRAGNNGFAYTFLTPDQAKYSADIIRALEMSKNPVPEDLQQMFKDYKAEMEAQGRTVKSHSGFLGKGFKFDETERQLAEERKKIQKAALGIHDSDDEDTSADIDEQIENMFASRKRVTDVAAPIINSTSAPTAGNQKKLEIARKLASMIHVQRNIGAEAQDITQQTASAILKGVGATPQVSSKTIAEQMAEKINAKLGYTPAPEDEKDSESSGETFKRYEEELEINDFPQTARWKVTSKEALAQICEYSEAGITVRGTYIPPKQEPKEGERKLYLAIEAVSEISVSTAKKEITRLIKEELCRLQNSYQPINKGRYKVL